MKRQMHRKKLVSYLAALLALLMFSGVLASCKDNGETNAPTDTSKSTESSAAYTEDKGYPQSGDYGGREFRIMQRTEFSYEFDAEEYNTDTINDAVYTRNKLIEDRYKVKIATTNYNHTWQNPEMLTALTTIMESNEDAFDLISGYQAYTIFTIMNGYYLDWAHDVPYMNLDAYVWQNGVNESTTINGKCYAITGDLAITFWKHMSAMVFNKSMLDEISDENIYDVIFDGNWTFEYMKNLCKNVKSDLNGDGIMDESDKYGFGSDWDVAIDCYKEAFNCPTVIKTASDKFILNIGGDKMVDVTEALKSFYSSDYVFCYKGVDPLKKMFKQNQIMFNIVRFEMIERLRDYDGDYGIIPYPKWDIDQENYGAGIVDGVSMFYVPRIVSDAEFVGVITMALAEQNYENVIPEYYDIVLKGKCTKDDESWKMLDLIRDSASQDFGQLFSRSLNGVGHLFREVAGSTINPTTTPGGKNMSSVWESNEKATMQKIQEMMEFYQK
ncbi:MAG: hypothetical protein ACI3XQ_03125 [Eubacteriales bacterium]